MATNVGSALKGISLHLPHIPSLTYQLRAKLLNHVLDAGLPLSQRLCDLLLEGVAGLLFVLLLLFYACFTVINNTTVAAKAERGGLLDPLPLGDGGGGVRMCAVDARSYHVERGARRVADVRLVQLHLAREAGEVSHDAQRVPHLDLVQKHDHGAAGLEMLEAQGELDVLEAVILVELAVVLGVVTAIVIAVDVVSCAITVAVVILVKTSSGA